MDRISLNKSIGCLLGGAIGDALGAPVEFDDINRIKANHGERGITDFVEFPGNVGAFTDNTQMTLFTAEGLLRAQHRAMLKGIGGALYTITLQSYLRWLYTQDHSFDKEHIELDATNLGEGWIIRQKALYSRRSPGNTCLSALRNHIEGTTQNPINDSKGCGTIMRMAPVGLMFYGNNKLSFKTGCDLSAITHGHPTGYLSAGFLANLVQYTPKALAYMQAQRFFIEHSFKEAKYILGMDEFQTRKWLAWYHQVAMNIMTMGFMLKEKLLNFRELPLLSAKDIKDWLSFVLAKELTETDMIQMIFNRHKRRQHAINSCYLKEYANLSK